jgi:ER membrane protein SH3
MYITVTIPAIRTVVTPVEAVDTREDQIEALRLLSAGNTLIIVLLGGVLAMQVRERHVFLWRGEHRYSPPSFFFGAYHAHERGARSGRGDWK